MELVMSPSIWFVGDVRNETMIGAQNTRNISDYLVGCVPRSLIAFSLWPD